MFLSFSRIPNIEASYNKARFLCEDSFGSLLRVEQLKFIDWDIMKTVTRYPIFRLDARKGA